MHDSFVHIVKELHGGDLASQALIDLNGPLHSNWARLLELVTHFVTNK
jgi:hypothetical protein